MAEEKKTAVISEADAQSVILTAVKRIKDKATEKGDLSKWSVSMHASLIWAIVSDLGLPEDCKADFMAYGKAFSGVYGNSAGFTQIKEIEEIVGGKTTRQRKLEIYD